MRALRVAAPCQLSLGLLDLPVSASLWQSLPEEIRHQVLGLLARLIAKGPSLVPIAASRRPAMRDTIQPGVSTPALLLTTDKIAASHRSRDAYVYAPIHRLAGGAAH